MTNNTTATMTTQDAFNTIVRHLRTMTGPSMATSLARPVEMCAYRGVDTNGNPAKCAVGALIPDSEYHPSLEGVTVGHVGPDGHSAVYNLMRRLYPGVDIMMLQDMQMVHDSWHSSQPWSEHVEEKSQEVARRFNLAMPEKGA